MVELRIKLVCFYNFEDDLGTNFRELLKNVAKRSRMKPIACLLLGMEWNWWRKKPSTSGEIVFKNNLKTFKQKPIQT